MKPEVLLLSCMQCPAGVLMFSLTGRQERILLLTDTPGEAIAIHTVIVMLKFDQDNSTIVAIVQMFYNGILP